MLSQVSDELIDKDTEERRILLGWLVCASYSHEDEESGINADIVQIFNFWLHSVMRIFLGIEILVQ